MENIVEKPTRWVPEYVAAIFLGIGLSLYGMTYALSGLMPTGLKLVDEVKYPNDFIAERAQNILREFVSIGPRVIGTDECHVKTIELLKSKVADIQKTAVDIYEIESQVSYGSGAFVEYDYVKKYQYNQAFVVRIRSKVNPSNYSLLLDCHYDTVPFSEGASDDGISCAAMLEIMRVMVKSSDSYRANIIFLFNGDEENGRQGAHGFIVNHPWFKTVRAVINLEADGSGGPVMLFQSGPGHPWLLKHYAKVVPYPHGNSIGEDIFQSGVIPSFTDFSIYRDFGNIPGMDFAFYRNGYVYHTKHDTFDKIPLGSYQHLGGNILALTRSLVNSNELENPSAYSEGRMIFYDIFGCIFISYSSQTGLIINLVVAAVSCVMIYLSLMEIEFRLRIYIQLFTSALVQVVGLLLAVAICVVISIIIDKLHGAMSWYDKSYVIYGIYICPALIGMSLPLIILHLLQRKSTKFNVSQNVKIHTHATSLIYTILLIVLTILESRAAYIFMIMVLFYSLAYIVITFGRINNEYIWSPIYSLFCTFPIILNMYLTFTLLSTLIPVFGRIGSIVNIELFVGILSAIICILVSSFLVPLLLLIKKPLYVLAALLGFSLLSVGLVLLTPFGFPYNNNSNMPATQRFITYHLHNQYYDFHNNLIKNETGIAIVKYDRNSHNTLMKYIPEMKEAKCLSPECIEEIYCGLPHYKISIKTVCQESILIPFTPPPVKKYPELKVLNRTIISPNVERIHFNVTGPIHINIMITPKPNVKIVNWDIIDELPKPIMHLKNRDIFFIRQSQTTRENIWNFWMDLEFPGNKTQYLMDIAIIGHYMHNTTQDNYEYQKFLSQFPNWTDVIPFISTHTSYQL